MGIKNRLKPGTTTRSKPPEPEIDGTGSHNKVGTAGTREGVGTEIAEIRSHNKVGTARTRENERATPPQRENPMPRPDPDTQRAAPPTVQGAPALQNERFAQPQRENPVPRPDPGTQRAAPPHSPRCPTSTGFPFQQKPHTSTCSGISAWIRPTRIATPATDVPHAKGIRTEPTTDTKPHRHLPPQTHPTPPEPGNTPHLQTVPPS